jgi:hypothetical protein
MYLVARREERVLLPLQTTSSSFFVFYLLRHDEPSLFIVALCIGFTEVSQRCPGAACFKCDRLAVGKMMVL